MMTRVDRDMLQTFLTASGAGAPLTKKAMQVLEPLYVMAERGDYDLKAPSDELAHLAAVAVKKATGTEIVSTTFARRSDASLSRLDSLYSDSLPHSTLSTHIRSRYPNVMRARENPDSLMSDLEAVMFESVLARLLSTGSLRIYESRHRILGTFVRTNVHNSILAYLSQVLAGNHTQVDEMTPLITLFRWAIPACDLNNAPGHYLIFCA